MSVLQSGFLVSVIGKNFPIVLANLMCSKNAVVSPASSNNLALKVIVSWALLALGRSVGSVKNSPIESICILNFFDLEAV